MKRITLKGCVQGRATQLLQSFLSALRLLPVTLNFQRIAGTIAGGTQLIQIQLLWRFGFLKLEDSHAFIYGERSTRSQSFPEERTVETSNRFIALKRNSMHYSFKSMIVIDWIMLSTPVVPKSQAI